MCCLPHFLQTVSHLRGVEATTQHLRRQQNHAPANGTGSKNLGRVYSGYHD